MDYFKTRYKYISERKLVWKAICEYLQSYVPVNSVVLDFGSGYCDFINQIEASKKIAVDTNEDSKEFCNNDVRFYTSIDLAIEDGKFYPDVVFMSNILEHLNEDELDVLFGRLKKILKKGGKLIIIQPNYYYSYRTYWDDYTHKKAFSHVSLSDFIMSQGFDVIKVEKKFLPFSMSSLIPKSYWLTKIYLMLHLRLFSGQMLLIAKKN